MGSFGLLILRLVIGSLYMLHGLPKLIGGEGSSDRLSDDAKKKLGDGFSASMEHGGVQNTVKMLESIGVPNAPAMAWLVILTEFLGGLALILGWKTRWAALGLTAVQGVAIGKIHAPSGVSGSEFNGALMAATAALALTGPGKIALD